MNVRGLAFWLTAAGVIGLVLCVVHLGQYLTPAPGVPLPWNPIALALVFATGQAQWPHAATWLLAALAVLLAAAVVAFYTQPGRGSKKQRSRGLAQRLTSKQNLSRVTKKGRKDELQHLHPHLEGSTPGVPIGRALTPGRQWVFQSFRQCAVHIWGPGRGKTSTQVARHAFYAPGPYLMTSNKTDGVRWVIAARMIRMPKGRAWIFDPTRIFRQNEQPAFTVPLLSSVTNTGSALELAEVFEAASKGGAEIRGDAHFDHQGREYLAWCFLAAAATGTDLRQVHRWVSEGNTRDVATALRKHGYKGPVAFLVGLGEQPEKTRGSVFATAQRMASPMVHDHLMAWVTPTPGVPVFDAARFVDSDDTLILLSQEKAGPMAAFISAFLLGLFTQAQRRAGQEPTERLPRPLVADLDECGNTVTLTSLPDWYTHFGSKGIIVNSYWQGPAQGDRTLGREGFAQLVDAAGERVYGGGVADADWLGNQSKLLGTYEKRKLTESNDGYGRHSISSTTHETDRATVAELANLPEWRALVTSSSGVTVLVETVPVWEDKEFTEVLQLAATIKG